MLLTDPAAACREWQVEQLLSQGAFFEHHENNERAKKQRVSAARMAPPISMWTRMCMCHGPDLVAVALSSVTACRCVQQAAQDGTIPTVADLTDKQALHHCISAHRLASTAHLGIAFSLTAVVGRLPPGGGVQGSILHFRFGR